MFAHEIFCKKSAGITCSDQGVKTISWISVPHCFQGECRMANIHRQVDTLVVGLQGLAAAHSSLALPFIWSLPCLSLPNTAHTWRQTHMSRPSCLKGWGIGRCSEVNSSSWCHGRLFNAPISTLWPLLLQVFPASGHECFWGCSHFCNIYCSVYIQGHM